LIIPPLVLAFTFTGLRTRAQEHLIPSKGNEMIEQFLAGNVERIGRRVFEGASSPAEWEAIRPRLKRELFQMLGLLPLPERTPLEARLTATVQRDGGVVIETIHFQSRPGLYVTGNLYRPGEAKGKLPAVLYVCGHAGRGRDGNKTAFQDHGMWFARNGYITLLIDTLQLGEVAGLHHGTYNLGRWWWQAAGYTPAGVECWNGIRAIDYLISRPDVDPARIGVTGISGGGAATFWIAAADDRVACAAPTSGISDLESYVDHRIINGHCDCMFMINTYRWEWTTIAALVAPRPLLFANSDHDPIFPSDGNARIIDRLRKLYAMLGHPDRIAEHVSPGGHDYRPDLRMAIFRWMNLHLKHESGPVQDASDPPIDGKRLRAFPEDKDFPGDARNGRIDETFVAVAKPKLPGPADQEKWSAERLAQLRGLSLRSLPERIPPGQPRPRDDQNKDLLWLATEPGIEVAVLDLRRERESAKRGTVIVLNENEVADKVPVWAKPIAGEDAVVVLAPRGVGPTAWVRKSPPNYVERAHALLGRTVDEGRVWDVAAVARWAADCRTWRVAGSRQAGIIGAYAALFEPSIQEVVVVDPPASHRDGPIFLNVIQVVDIPTALGLLEPRPLTLIGAGGDAWQLTRRLYVSAGAGKKLVFE
jgi:cephalosporin-C deacetylase-like acetyl esterase